MGALLALTAAFAKFKLLWQSFREFAGHATGPVPGQISGETVLIRSELVTHLASENSDLTVREVEAIVECFFDDIIEQLAANGRVELRGFGTFSTRARDGRTGRNPRTGDAVAVASKRVPYFKPGKEMRDRLNV